MFPPYLASQAYLPPTQVVILWLSVLLLHLGLLHVACHLSQQEGEQHYTCNTTPATLHLQHYTCNTTPATLHLQHYTYNTTPTTLHLQHYTYNTTSKTLHLQQHTADQTPAGEAAGLGELSPLQQTRAQVLEYTVSY